MSILVFLLEACRRWEEGRIACVDPLPSSKLGIHYLLIVMCQSTRYPAAYPLHTITAKSVVKLLTLFISIQSSYVKNNPASAYHAQGQGALDRFYQTLKSVMRGYCIELDWLLWLLLAAERLCRKTPGLVRTNLCLGIQCTGRTIWTPSELDWLL